MLGKQLFLPLCQSDRFFFCNISKQKKNFNVQAGPIYFFQPKAVSDYFSKSPSAPPLIMNWSLPKNLDRSACRRQKQFGDQVIIITLETNRSLAENIQACTPGREPEGSDDPPQMAGDAHFTETVIFFL